MCVPAERDAFQNWFYRLVGHRRRRGNPVLPVTRICSFHVDVFVGYVLDLCSRRDLGDGLCMECFVGKQTTVWHGISKMNWC